jgi:hypothetical protein
MPNGVTYRYVAVNEGKKKVEEKRKVRQTSERHKDETELFNRMKIVEDSNQSHR